MCVCVCVCVCVGVCVCVCVSKNSFLMDSQSCPTVVCGKSFVGFSAFLHDRLGADRRTAATTGGELNLKCVVFVCVCVCVCVCVYVFEKENNNNSYTSKLATKATSINCPNYKQL